VNDHDYRSIGYKDDAIFMIYRVFNGKFSSETFLFMGFAYADRFEFPLSDLSLMLMNMSRKVLEHCCNIVILKTI